MSFHHALEAFRGALAECGGVTVELSPPSSVVPSSVPVRLWAWRLEESSSVRLRPGADGASGVPDPLTVRCLLICSDLALLDTLRGFVHQHPVLVAGGARVEVRADVLPAELLVSLFLTAQTPPLPCLAYAVREVAA